MNTLDHLQPEASKVETVNTQDIDDSMTIIFIRDLDLPQSMKKLSMKSLAPLLLF